MKQRIFVLLTAVLVLLLALSLFGCEKQNSENNQQTNEYPEIVIVEKEPADYSKMSKEEIIEEFMKAWENDDIAVMDELSDFAESFTNSQDFSNYGYHGMFCWGNVSFPIGDYLICDHGCDNFSHAVNDLEIRQSDNTDYGCAPEELQSLHPNYENTYAVSFMIEENSIIRHLEMCAFGGEEGKLVCDQAFEQTGKYSCSQYFKMKFDEEKGHWVIVTKTYAV